MPHYFSWIPAYIWIQVWLVRPPKHFTLSQSQILPSTRLPSSCLNLDAHSDFVKFETDVNVGILMLSCSRWRLKRPVTLPAITFINRAPGSGRKTNISQFPQVSDTLMAIVDTAALKKIPDFHLSSNELVMARVSSWIKGRAWINFLRFLSHFKCLYIPLAAITPAADAISFLYRTSKSAHAYSCQLGSLSIRWVINEGGWDLDM